MLLANWQLRVDTEHRLAPKHSSESHMTSKPGISRLLLEYLDLHCRRRL